MKVDLCHDPVLPQREAVVRPAEVAERLSSLLGVGEPLPVRDCRVARVNYQPGKSLRVVYELELPGQHLIVALRAFPSGRSDKSASAYGKAVVTAIEYDGVRGVAHDPELNAVFWTFPNDGRLTRLAAVWRTPARDFPTAQASRDSLIFCKLVTCSFSTASSTTSVSSGFSSSSWKALTPTISFRLASTSR